ncbi:MAG: energy transducer TonB, partial [Fulvivirga sp.]|nr:energy transducer TonB [Fulvivirga sp.]
EYKSKVVEEPIDPMTNTIEDDWVIPPTIIKPPPPPKPVIPEPVEVENEKVTVELPEDIFDVAPEAPIEIEVSTEALPDEKIETIIDIAEEMPSPIGGLEAFYKYIRQNMRYPAQARRLEVEGKVYVKFVVMEDGTLDQVHVIKGIGAGCDEEVLRVLKKAPRWNPGKQRGKPVKVWKVVPISFQLDN